jgi:MFS family permease
VLSILAGFASVPLLVVLSVANGVVAAVGLPAASALIPQTVPAARSGRPTPWPGWV